MDLENTTPGQPLLLKEEDYNPDLIAIEADRIATAETNRENATPEVTEDDPIPDWAGTHAADMSLDQMAQARDVIQARMSYYQTKLQMLASAVASLDSRAASRFGQTLEVQADWPEEAILEEFNWVKRDVGV